MEVGGEGNYIPIATLSPPKSSALRWAAMKAIRCFIIVRDKVTRQRPQTTTFEEKGEPKRIRTEIPLLTSLTPYRLAKPAHPGESEYHHGLYQWGTGRMDGWVGGGEGVWRWGEK